LDNNAKTGRASISQHLRARKVQLAKRPAAGQISRLDQMVHDVPKMTYGEAA
jgi:hypothetical protein